MSILGMGSMEVLVVLLVAFILLGPQRMVDAARLLGKASRELRRMADELPALTLDEEPSERPIVHRGGGPKPSVTDTPPDEESGPVLNEDAVEFKPSPESDSDVTEGVGERKEP